MIEIPGVGIVKVSAIDVVSELYKTSTSRKYNILIRGCEWINVDEKNMLREELIKKIEEHDA